MYFPHDIIKQVIMTCLEAELENISMSEAKSRFSEYLSRAASGERFVILRRQRPLAAIIGAGELARLERSAEITRRLAHSLGQSRKLLEAIEAGETHPAMAAFGLWKDETDLADLEEIVKKNRRSPSSRPEVDL
jgi:prevent-host-death family protein